MSALSRLPRGRGYAGLRMTAEEYLALGETFERYELIDGVVMMSPSPTPLHQRMVSSVLFQLDPSSCEHASVVAFPATDVRFGCKLVYRPDISVYRAERMTQIPDRLTTPPDLIVEVLSRGTRSLDLTTKRDDYGRYTG